MKLAKFSLEYFHAHDVCDIFFNVIFSFKLARSRFPDPKLPGLL